MIKESWQARLDLRINRRDDKSILARCAHQGPLRVQKALYPEGDSLCHTVILHPPGGIAGADELAVRIEVGEKAQALVTTPGAGKWYRGGGRKAVQDIRLTVGKGGTLEWLPQENIFFDGVDASQSVHVLMDEGASFLGLEASCLGRTAAGEEFLQGRIALKSRLNVGGKLIWYERGILEGGSSWLAHPAGLAGFSVLATLLAVGPMVDAELLAACRDVEQQPGLSCGTTLLPGGLLVARCLGGSAERVRSWFVALWTVLRPSLINKNAAIPRIWNT